jgi:D-glycero-D-manno-heptose 1,7-bisphosphate phosphatase
MHRSIALFLDRDGVINVDHGYVHRIADFDFMDGVFDLCKLAARAGLLLIVVTNQGGIARGYYSESDFLTLTNWMKERFDEVGAPLTDVFFDPTHPTAGVGAYRRESIERKPNPGMLLKAAEKWSIDLSRSFMIGDMPSDMLAARRAGIPHRLLFSQDKFRDTADASVRITTMRQAEEYLSGHLFEKDRSCACVFAPKQHG